MLLDTNLGTRPLEPFLLRTRLIIAALLATFFLCLSSSINPIIYNFTNGEFRREFRKCCFRRERTRTESMEAAVVVDNDFVEWEVRVDA